MTDSGRCSGCGACSLLDASVSMTLNDEGFIRPQLGETPGKRHDKKLADSFRQLCPGVGIDGRRLSAPMSHPIFGGYFGVWTGFASDEAIRFSGSSGGVLTALSNWLIQSKKATSILGVGPQKDLPSRSVPVRITSREEALAASGSRYAPVANASQYIQNDSQAAFVGKPCEVYAVSQLEGGAVEGTPIRLSFFCAGTPSQSATDQLISNLGEKPESIASLRYRGNGWPGYFSIEGPSGHVSNMSYDDSWGKHLGRSLQWRCKTCVDGTGEFADISVGDFWETDAKGYPVFDDSDGNSVVIARTQRGLELVREAVAAGVLELSSADINALMDIQPLQRIRRATLAGRLLGRVLGGKKVPIYRGFGLTRLTVTSARQSVRAAAGTFLRTIRSG